MASTERNGANGTADDFPVLHRDTADQATFHAAVWDPVFNHRRPTERVPRAVVKARTAAHVRQAVELAARENCRVSVRSGGHSWAAWSVRDDAVLIDLGGLPGGKTSDAPLDEGISYDPATHVVTKGRMFAGGHCPDVGLGGFLLQGGMGWNCKVRNKPLTTLPEDSWLTVVAELGMGLRVHHRRRCRHRRWKGASLQCGRELGLVLGSARIRSRYYNFMRSSIGTETDPVLGFPAIVTRFHLKTVPLFEMYQSLYIYPISEYRTVQKWVVDVRKQPLSASYTQPR